MLVACRLAGLSALEAYYEGVDAVTQSGGGLIGVSSIHVHSLGLSHFYFSGEIAKKVVAIFTRRSRDVGDGRGP
jgi:hypothetical protein